MTTLNETTEDSISAETLVAGAILAGCPLPWVFSVFDDVEADDVWDAFEDERLREIAEWALGEWEVGDRNSVDLDDWINTQARERPGWAPKPSPEREAALTAKKQKAIALGREIVAEREQRQVEAAVRDLLVGSARRRMAGEASDLAAAARETSDPEFLVERIRVAKRGLQRIAKDVRPLIDTGSPEQITGSRVLEAEDLTVREVPGATSGSSSWYEETADARRQMLQQAAHITEVTRRCDDPGTLVEQARVATRELEKVAKCLRPLIDPEDPDDE